MVTEKVYVTTSEGLFKGKSYENILVSFYRNKFANSKAIIKNRCGIFAAVKM